MEIMIIFFLVCGVLLGGAIGSFIGVVERRSARGESFIAARGDHSGKQDGASRSRCESCNTQLGFIELIPVFSFLALRGRCRHCGVRLSNEYLWLELAGAGVAVVALGFAWTQMMSGVEFFSRALAWTLYGWMLLALYVVDFKQQLLPDWITLPAITVAVPLSFFILDISFASQALGAAIAGGFFLLQFVVSRGRWIGGGDIRLGVLMGVMLGVKATVVALWLGYIFGAAVAVRLLLTKRAGKETQLAFGTFLTIATFVCLFFGDRIANLYLSVLGF